MNDYQEVRLDIDPCCEDATDLLAGMLADIGYESFVPDEKGLTAYIPAHAFNPEALKAVITDFPFDAMIVVNDNFIEGQDWNAQWEKHYFKPIVVADKVVIHSTFHTDVPQAEHRIVIDPKMAFGTGHHATTSQVITNLLDLDLNNKTVIDMGTGTAILAILASKLGASKVTGVEIDGFAYNNAIENLTLNGVSNVTLINGDAAVLADLGTNDVFIANINRNVITADIHSYASALKHMGIMLLSGFYFEDIPIVEEAAANYGLTRVSYTEHDNWVCLELQKTAN